MKNCIGAAMKMMTKKQNKSDNDKPLYPQANIFVLYLSFFPPYLCRLEKNYLSCQSFID